MPPNERFSGVFVPRIVLADRNLTASEKLLLSEIHWLDRGNERGGCYATNAHFAEILAVSTRQISRMISRLRHLDYIEWEAREDFRAQRLIRSRIPDEAIRRPLQALPVPLAPAPPQPIWDDF